MRKLLLAGLLSMFFLAGCSLMKNKETELELVKDGKASVEIVLAAKPTRSAQFAAYELRNYLKQITGVSVPILHEPDIGNGRKIYVGETELARRHGYANEAFEPQEYVIKTVQEGLIISGRDEADYSKVVYDSGNLLKMKGIPGIWSEPGTLYGMYDFIENNLGVRWFNQTESGTVLPAFSGSLAVKVKDIRRAPFLLYRAGSYSPARYDEQSCAWQANTPQFKTWQEAAYPELKQKYRNKPAHFQRARAVMSELFLLRSRNGGEESHCNHSFYGYYDRFWQKNPKIPQVFENHRPEYFSNEGNLADNVKPEQMCYSSDALVAQVVADADAYFKGNPAYRTRQWQWGKRFFAIVPQDNSFFCKCEKCTEFEKKHPKQIVFDFVNRCARELKKSHPDKFVSCLAYAQYETPPDFPLEDNVIVHFCFYGNREPDGCPEQLKQLENLKLWKKKYPKTTYYLWLYGCFPRLRARYGNYHYFPSFHAREAAKHYKMFKEFDIKGIFYDGFGEEVDAYIQFKLMNDPEADVEFLLKEYFTEMYGKAAVPMNDIYNLIEKNYHNLKNYPKDYYGRQTFGIAWGHLGTRERMDEIQKLLDRANKLADTPVAKHRIALWEKAIWSYMQEGRRRYEEKMNEPIPSLNVPRATAANGDPDKVDWSKHAEMRHWHKPGDKTPASRELNGKIVHDGEFLYLELNDPCDTGKLVTSSGVFAYDDWEILIGKQRGQPFRQYAVSPEPKMVSIARGEINMLAKIKIPNPPGMKASSLVTDGNWRVRLAFKLDEVCETPFKPGEKVYLNGLRVANPELAGLKSYLEISSWMSYSTVNDPDRMAELILEKNN